VDRGAAAAGGARLTRRIESAARTRLHAILDGALDGALRLDPPDPGEGVEDGPVLALRTGTAERVDETLGAARTYALRQEYGLEVYAAEPYGAAWDDLLDDLVDRVEQALRARHFLVTYDGGDPLGERVDLDTGPPDRARPDEQGLEPLYAARLPITLHYCARAASG
jgi:hypothetical protein